MNKTLNELPINKIPDKITDKLKKSELEFLNGIIGFPQNNSSTDNQRAQLLTNKSAESVKKYFAALVGAGILIAEGENKGQRYKLNECS